MRLASGKTFFASVYSKWKDDNVSRLGSALSFYAILALPPLLIVLISLLAIILGEQVTRDQLLAQISAFITPTVASAVEQIIQRLPQPEVSSIAGSISLIIFFFIATTLFGHLKKALHDVWHIASPKDRSVRHRVAARILSSVMVFVGGGLFLTAVLSETILSLAQSVLTTTPLPLVFFSTLSFIISSILIIFFFTFLFFLLPESSLRFKDALIGGLGTGLMFILGKSLMSLYLSHSNLISFYGAAGSVILLILWVYYSAQVLFLGATFLYVYTKKNKRPILSEQATWTEKFRKRFF